jgi:ribonuclease HII
MPSRYCENNVIGVDEAGRGAIAGPVVAAAVLLNYSKLSQFFLTNINDSKKLSRAKREILYNEIIADHRYSIGVIDNNEIDRINILNATLESMKLAVQSLLHYNLQENQISNIIIDGNIVPKFENITIPAKAVIKGDQKYIEIAAASIVAKVHRDSLMFSLVKYLEYEFYRNCGYGTKKHFEIINLYGASDIHRKSFLTKRKSTTLCL